MKMKKKSIFSNFFILIYYVFLTIIFLFLLNLNITIYAQGAQSYLDFFNSFNLFSNPAIYSLDDTLYSLSISNHFNQFNQININLLNGIVLSYLVYPDFENNRLLIGIPFYFKVKDYPLSLGVNITNLFINIGYYVKIFNFLENGLSIFYLFDENIELDKKFNYEFFLRLTLLDNIKIKAEFYLDNSIFYQNLIPEYFFENYLNYRFNILFDFKQVAFSFSYFSSRIIEFDFIFYRKFSAFNLSFSIDQINNNYSFGLGFSQSKSYKESKANAVLYIIDFNSIKPDANLFLQLREKIKQKGNTFLFITGKNLTKTTELEDLIPLIKQLKKSNLCYIYLQDLDLTGLALASSFNSIILNKVSNVDLSYKKLKEKIVQEFLNDIYQYLKFYNYYEYEISNLIESLNSDISKDERLNNFIFQQVQYLIELVNQNRNIDKQLLLNFVFSHNTLKNEDLLDLGFVDYLCMYNDLMTIIKEIAKKNEYEIKNIEFITGNYNKLYKDKTQKVKRIAIVYLKGLVVCEKDKNSENISSVINYKKIEKIIKKIEDEKYLAVLFINDSSFGSIEEGEKILSIIQNLSKKVKVYILLNSTNSTGTFLSTLTKENLFTHENSLIIPFLPMIYLTNFSLLNDNKSLYDNENDDQILQKIKSIIEKQRSLSKKEMDQINENSFLSGYQAVGINLIDYLTDFNSLIDFILKQLELKEKNVNFEIFYVDNFENKISFFEFINNILNQFVENFLK